MIQQTRVLDLPIFRGALGKEAVLGIDAYQHTHGLAGVRAQDLQRKIAEAGEMPKPFLAAARGQPLSATVMYRLQANAMPQIYPGRLLGDHRSQARALIGYPPHKTLTRSEPTTTRLRILGVPDVKEVLFISGMAQEAALFVRNDESERSSSFPDGAKTLANICFAASFEQRGNGKLFV